MTEVVDGVDNLRRAVRDRLRRGAHAIKIMTSGGVVSPSDPIRVPQYSADEVRAVAEEADRRGSYIAAHAYSPEAITHSVRNGVRSIEHGNLLDEPAEGLDAASTASLLDLLRTHVDQGMAVVMISHEAGELARLADLFAWVEVAPTPATPNDLVVLDRAAFLDRATGAPAHPAATRSHA